MRTHAAVVAVVAVVVLAGCSGVGGPPPGGDGTDATSTTAATPAGTLEVHFVNVGQSVATLVVGPTGETMLVDSGHYDDDGAYVLAYLQRRGVDRIDYLVTSHADADHVGGHAAVVEHYETEADGVGAVYDPGIAASTRTYEAYLDAVAAHGVTLYETRAGDEIPMEGVDVEVLGPPEPYLADGERNENSVVLRVTFGATSFLFTGDAGARQEAHLVETYGEGLRATVLKVGHHGSKTSTGGPLLDAVDPRVAVISSAYDSRYGHPHEEVLRRLADRGIPAYWTATHGDTVLVSDGRTVDVKTQRAAPTGPLALREGDPVEPGTTDPVETRATVDPDGVSTADADLRVVEVHADAAGDDRENLDDEYVVFENAGDEPLDLSGWRVADGSDTVYAFPDGFTLGPGERVTLYTGSGADTDAELHWGAGRPVWNNDGDTVVVRNADGVVVLREEY